MVRKSSSTRKGTQTHAHPSMLEYPISIRNEIFLFFFFISFLFPPKKKSPEKLSFFYIYDGETGLLWGWGAPEGGRRKKGNSKKLDLKYNLNREKISPQFARLGGGGGGGGGDYFSKDLKKRGLLRLFYLFHRLYKKKKVVEEWVRQDGKENEWQWECEREWERECERESVRERDREREINGKEN